MRNEYYTPSPLSKVTDNHIHNGLITRPAGIPDHTMNTMTTTNTMNTMSTIMFVEMLFKYYIILFAPKPPPLLALSSESSIKA